MTTSANMFSRMEDRSLLDAAKRLATDERRATAALLRALMEIDSRRLYLGEGARRCSATARRCCILPKGRPTTASRRRGLRAAIR
jgi:hypothetical protein